MDALMINSFCARAAPILAAKATLIAKGHMLKPRPLSTGLRDLYRINIGSGPGTGFAGGYHSAATQKSRESAGDAVFGRRSVDRTEGSKKLNSG